MTTTDAPATATPLAPPRLTTPAAWAELARWWDGAEVCKCGCGVTMNTRGCDGLCDSIAEAFGAGLIDDGQRAEMRAALRKATGKPTYTYFWPLTLAGARDRAAFCRRLAGGE